MGTIIDGRRPNGTLGEAQLDDCDNLYVTQPLASKGSFGELLANPHTPLLALTFAYNVNSDLVTTTTANGGTVTASNGHAVLSTSTATNGSAIMESLDSVRYVPGQGVTVRFTAVFTTPRANSLQIIGIGDANDGFFVGYNGTRFGVMRRSGGVANWIYSEDWSVQDDSYTLDPTKGNVYQIRYQWLGYGAIEFFIEEPSSGQLELVHRISYANSATSTSVRNPSFPLRAEISNSGNATNMVLQTPSMGAYCQGPEFAEGLRRFTSYPYTGIGTTETPIFSIRNDSTFQSITNRVRSILDFISVTNNSATATTDSIVSIRSGAAGLSPTPTWAAYSANTSCCSLSSNSTTMTPGSGTLLYQFYVDTTNPYQELLRPANLFFRPGTILTVSVAASAVTTQGRIALRWLEQF